MDNNHDEDDESPENIEMDKPFSPHARKHSRVDKPEATEYIPKEKKGRENTRIY